MPWHNRRLRITFDSEHPRPFTVLLFAGLSAMGIIGGISMGGIPEPDVLLFGSVRIDGLLQTATDTDVVVQAKVSEKTVGLYTMGDNRLAGDQYVLRIKLEWPVPESPLSDDAARRGNTVQVLVRRGTDAAQTAGTFLIERFGVIQNMVLRIGTEPDADGDSDADLRDVAVFQRCFTGPGPQQLSPECTALDLDSTPDGDVDLVDLNDFAPRVSGPR